MYFVPFRGIFVRINNFNFMAFNGKFFRIFLGVIVSSVLFSCGSGDKDKSKDDLGVDSLIMDAPKGDPTAISEEAMAEIIQSIPSPVEMSALIKAIGSEYNNSILNSTEKISNYTTNSEKALAIGIYGADLGYINIYEKTYSSLNYLNAIKGLADDIKVGQFFDFITLKRLAKSNKNVDSLLYISTTSYNNMDEYLRQQKRSGLSVLMACGAWLEGLFIAGEVVREKNNQELVERIGEQKPILDSLLKILTVYKTDPYCADLIIGFENIKKEYSNVVVESEFHEPETTEVNGELVVVDKSKSSVKITQEDVNGIITSVELVRKEVVK